MATDEIRESIGGEGMTDEDKLCPMCGKRGDMHHGLSKGVYSMSCQNDTCRVVRYLTKVHVRKEARE